MKKKNFCLTTTFINNKSTDLKTTKHGGGNALKSHTFSIFNQIWTKKKFKKLSKNVQVTATFPCY